MALQLISTGKDVPNDINVIIEIPKDAEPVKYEVDKATGAIFVDRVLSTPMRYPCNYGYIPQTLGGDGDPLDVLVLMQEPVVPLTIVRVRAIGGLRMRDDKGGDDKIIAVTIDDPAFNHYTDASQLPPHLVVELDRFFRDYTILAGKTSEVDRPYARAEALKIMRASLDAYRGMSAWKKG